MHAFGGKDSVRRWIEGEIWEILDLWTDMAVLDTESGCISQRELSMAD